MVINPSHGKGSREQKSRLTHTYVQALTPTLSSWRWQTFDLKLGERQKCKGAALQTNPPNHFSRAVDHVKSQGVRLVLEKDIAHRVSLHHPQISGKLVSCFYHPHSCWNSLSLRFSTYLVRYSMRETLWNKRAGRWVLQFNWLPWNPAIHYLL